MNIFIKFKLKIWQKNYKKKIIEKVVLARVRKKQYHE